ncbi:MAG TPA: hypothetical protein VK615_05450 [Candidatus Binatia bacterium]|nr:hypothetical protein [Candidatus Binatia bacterium]
MKIQPSLDRVNVNGRLGFETEDTVSSSDTRLFNGIAALATPASPEMKTANGASSLARMTNESCALHG